MPRTSQPAPGVRIPVLTIHDPELIAHLDALPAGETGAGFSLTCPPRSRRRSSCATWSACCGVGPEAAGDLRAGHRALRPPRRLADPGGRQGVQRGQRRRERDGVGDGAGLGAGVEPLTPRAKPGLRDVFRRGVRAAGIAVLRQASGRSDRQNGGRPEPRAGRPDRRHGGPPGGNGLDHRIRLLQRRGQRCRRRDSRWGSGSSSIPGTAIDSSGPATTTRWPSSASRRIPCASPSSIPTTTRWATTGTSWTTPTWPGSTGWSPWASCGSRMTRSRRGGTKRTPRRRGSSRPRRNCGQSSAAGR